MTSKLVFSVPDTQIASQVVEYLNTRGIEESGISVLGNGATELSSIPDAGEFDNDVVPASKRGIVVGGATGLLAGLGAALVLPGLAIGGAALALATAGGATFGVLASSLIGSSVTNSQIRDYEQVIERGELLMVVEVEEELEAEFKSEIQSQHADVQFLGEVDAIPPVV